MATGTEPWHYTNTTSTVPRVQTNVGDMTRGLRKLREFYMEIQRLLNKHTPKPKKRYRSLGKDEIMNAKHLALCQGGPW